VYVAPRYEQHNEHEPQAPPAAGHADQQADGDSDGRQRHQRRPPGGLLRRGAGTMARCHGLAMTSVMAARTTDRSVKRSLPRTNPGFVMMVW